MILSLTKELEDFVREKVQSGQYSSEEAVVEAALRRLKDADARPEDLIDRDFVAFCAREGDEGITLEEVLDATSRISGSMAQSIIEEERVDRI